MFGQLGGMDSILFIIFSMLIKNICSKIYTVSLLSSFYHVTNQDSFEIHPKIIEEKKEIQLSAIQKSCEISEDSISPFKSK